MAAYNHEFNEMLQRLSDAEAADVRNFSSGFQERIGRPFFKLLKKAGIVSARRYVDDTGAFSSATITTLTSNLINFSDDRGRNYGIELSAVRRREHWEVSAFPPLILPPAGGLRRQTAEANITVTPSGGHSMTIGLDGSTYGDAMRTDESVGIYPSERYDYKQFMSAWAIARTVIAEQLAPDATALDSLLAPRPYPEDYDLAALYEDDLAQHFKRHLY